MVRVLFISGDGDFAAMSVEQDYGIDKAIQLCEENGGSYTIDDDEKRVYADLKIIEFGEVDPKFIDFIEDKFIDYDFAKNTNFYVI